MAPLFLFLWLMPDKAYATTAGDFKPEPPPPEIVTFVTQDLVALQTAFERQLGQGSYLEAKDQADKIITAAKAIYADNDLRLAPLFTNRAIAQHHAGNLTAAVAAYEQAISLIQVHGNYRHPHLATPLAGLGVAQYQLGLFDDASDSLLQSAFVIRADKGLKSQEQLRYYEPLMQSLYAAGRFDEALQRQQIRVAVVERSSGNGPELLMALEGAAAWAHRLGLYLPERRFHNQRLDIIQDAHGFEDPRLVPVLWDITRTYQKMLDPDILSLSSLQRAERIQKEHPETTAVERAQTKLRLGDLYMTFEGIIKGLAYYRSARKILVDAGEDDLAQEWFGDPVVLIYTPPGSSGPDKARPGRQILGKATAILEVTANGRPREVKVTKIDPEQAEKSRIKIARAIREAKFRPRITAQGTQRARDVEMEFQFLFTP